MRKRAVVGLLAAGALLGAATITGAQALTPNDAACRSGLTFPYDLGEATAYNACRFDRLDAAVKALQPSATPSATPTPTRTPTPSPTPTPTPSGFPDASSTGVPAGVALTSYTGPATITTAGTVIDGKSIGACIVVKANNVTIKNSKFTNLGCYWQVLNDSGNTGLALTDVELTGGADATVAGDNYTVTRADVQGSADGFKAGSNVVIQDSYVHDLAITADSHNDGIQSLGTNSLKVLRNSIVVEDGATSAVILSTGSASSMRNVQISGNLLGGGAFTVYGGYEAGRDTLSKVANINVTDNQFTTAILPRSGAYGPLTSVDSPVVVSGNTWADGPNKGQSVS